MLKNCSFVCFGLLVGFLITSVGFRQEKPAPTWFAAKARAAEPAKLPPVCDIKWPAVRDEVVATITDSFVEEQDEGVFVTDDKDKRPPTDDRKPVESRPPNYPRPVKPVQPSGDNCQCNCGCANCTCAGNTPRTAPKSPTACQTPPGAANASETPVEVIYATDEGQDEGRGGGRIRKIIGRIIHRRGGEGGGIRGRLGCGGGG